jgi:hypothetical protein
MTMICDIIGSVCRYYAFHVILNHYLACKVSGFGFPKMKPVLVPKNDGSWDM